MSASDRVAWYGRLHVSWPMLLLAGWLLYEFTAQPGLAALVACAKFGWTDVRTAFWLRRVDPNRARGQTCFWSYLTFGLWKVAILSGLAMILLGFALALVDQMGGQPPRKGGWSPVLDGAASAALVGIGLSFLTTYLAFGSARRNGVRIWLGQAANRARKDRFWPPHHGGINAAPFVVFTSLILTMFIIVLFLVASLVLLNANGWAIAGSWMAAWLAFFALLALYSWSQQAIARSPQECWDCNDEEAVFQTSNVH